MPPLHHHRNSYKLDCFSYGVLTIQILSKVFPDPEGAHAEVSASSIRQVPEIERRQKHIDLVDPDHQLLSIALKCLEHSEADRPAADEICESIASVKREELYNSSVESHKDHASLFDKLFQGKQLYKIEKAEMKTEFDKQLQQKDHVISVHLCEIKYLKEQLEAKTELVRSLSQTCMSGELTSNIKVSGYVCKMFPFVVVMLLLQLP